MLIVVATQEELKLVKKYGYEKYPCLITGVGAINVIKALKDIPKETEIVNIGYCGSNSMKIGKKVYVDTVSLYHPSVDYVEEKYILENGFYPCYTSTDFVTETHIKEPCVFDMELAFICALGFKSVKSIKCVSDNLSVKEYENSIK